MTIANYLEDKWLDTLSASVGYNAADTYLKLHTGAPGEDCTANAAGETTRQEVTFIASSGGSKVSNATVTWTNVSTTETYTHWSMWDASTSGNALWYGALSSNAAVTAGDTFEITSLTLTLD
jgi:hypothetical protein